MDVFRKWSTGNDFRFRRLTDHVHCCVFFSAEWERLVHVLRDVHNPVTSSYRRQMVAGNLEKRVTIRPLCHRPMGGTRRPEVRGPRGTTHLTLSLAPCISTAVYRLGRSRLQSPAIMHHDRPPCRTSMASAPNGLFAKAAPTTEFPPPLANTAQK